MLVRIVFHAVLPAFAIPLRADQPALLLHTRAATKQSCQGATPDSGSGETKSSRALAERRQADSVLAQKTGIVAALKGGLANWDGRLTGRADPSDAADAAGSSAGGAVWASITELKEAAAKMADNERGKAPEAMSTIVAQTVKKATGVTRVSESLAAAARERTSAWACGLSGYISDTLRVSGPGLRLTGPCSSRSNAEAKWSGKFEVQHPQSANAAKKMMQTVLMCFTSSL